MVDHIFDHRRQQPHYLAATRRARSMLGGALGQVSGMGPKLAAWALRLEAGVIGEVTIAISCEDREESSRRRNPQGTCWAGPCSFFLNV
jgi:hypothetical protein